MDYVKNIDLCRCLSLLLVVCTQSVEEFTTPVAGDYQIECWGAGSQYRGNPYCGGGYSYGEISLKSNTLLYVCVGARGNSYNGVTGGKKGYNGGGDGGNGFPPYTGGSGGGGATHVAFSSGLLKELETVYKQKLILVAGGAGGGSNGSIAGFGGGSEGGKPASNPVYVGQTLIIPPRYGTSANQISGYKFGEGQQGMTKSKYGNGGAEGGGGGGGGLYGGFSTHEEGEGTNWAGGGGSGYVNTSLLTNAKTIAGNTDFPSPNGGTEKGHLDDGACIVTQISF